MEIVLKRKEFFASRTIGELWINGEKFSDTLEDRDRGLHQLMSLEEIKRGDDAKRLIENPLFKGAFEAVKDGLVHSMTQSAMGDEKTHNRLVIALQLLNQIERSLITHIETGKLALIQSDETLGRKLKRVING